MMSISCPIKMQMSAKERKEYDDDAHHRLFSRFCSTFALFLKVILINSDLNQCSKIMLLKHNCCALKGTKKSSQSSAFVLDHPF